MINYYSVFDIGGTSIKHAVMDGKAQFYKTTSHVTPDQGNGDIFHLLIEIIKQDQEQYPIKGVALSVPGAITPASGDIHYAGAVTDLIGVNIKSRLEEAGVPIEAENDANCAALAEKWRGNAKGCQNFITLTIGTGIGGGIFINGNIHHGVDGMAGELGLMMLHTSFPLTRLIEEQTFSRLGSTWNLLDRINKKLKKNLNGEQIFKLYEEGHEVIQKEVDYFFDVLAIGTANIVHTFAPEKVLFGGGVSVQENFIVSIRKRLELINPHILQMTTIDRCQFGNQSGQVGALYHFLRGRGE
ncbi:beta-glucoside kinase [Bacillus pakistanensis]|uniref:Beta-glucoside kinase n=1 Tax=Rossellomorea pakistanensis TaxID=992288 RepID=A0ABS2NCN5_9BACI|nr:beta-glucoside kinase [Bacillus pakistanensis]